MVRSRKMLVAVVALAAALVLGTTGLWLRLQDAGTADPRAAARTSFPDLTPASGPPMLPSLDTLHPAPGTIVQASGPFDERFDLGQLAFDGRTVTGTARITSDVSDILEFEALAGFYDRNGALIGTARDTYHLDESHSKPHAGPPDEGHEFTIKVPEALKGAAVAAAVGVPVLVNE